VAAHLTRPKPVVEFLPRDNFFRPFRQEQQVAEIGGAQRDGNAPVEKELLIIFSILSLAACNHWIQYRCSSFLDEDVLFQILTNGTNEGICLF